MKLIKEEFLSRSRSDFPFKILSLEIESFSIVYQICIRCNKFTAFKFIFYTLRCFVFGGLDKCGENEKMVVNG